MYIYDIYLSYIIEYVNVYVYIIYYHIQNMFNI